MPAYVICWGSNKDQTEEPIAVRSDRTVALRAARGMAMTMIAADGVHAGDWTVEEETPVVVEHPVEPCLESEEVLRIRFYDRRDDLDDMPHGYLAVHAVDDVDVDLQGAELRRRVTALRDANRARIAQYVADGGEEHHYLDGKEKAYCDVLQCIAGAAVEPGNAGVERPGTYRTDLAERVDPESDAAWSERDERRDDEDDR